jgi:hypothetical protein
MRNHEQRRMGVLSPSPADWKLITAVKDHPTARRGVLVVVLSTLLLNVFHLQRSV